MFLPKVCFAHISYTSFRIQLSSCKMLHKRNFMRTQTLKTRGNIDLDIEIQMLRAAITPKKSGFFGYFLRAYKRKSWSQDVLLISQFVENAQSTSGAWRQRQIGRDCYQSSMEDSGINQSETSDKQNQSICLVLTTDKHCERGRRYGRHEDAIHNIEQRIVWNELMKTDQFPGGQIWK